MVDNSGYHRVVLAENKKIACANKCMIDVGQVIDKPYETVFSVTDRQTGDLVEITEPQSQITFEFFTGLDEPDAPEPDEEMAGGAAAPTEETKDNRNLHDTNSAQQMKHSDVLYLKESNVEGQQIIDALVQNSKTYQERTTFSKVKYLKKKKEKYAVWFEARKPTALNLCETYLRSQPERICHMRPDSLALVLNLANISFESHVLLVENTKGLIQGALAERCVAYALRVEFHDTIAQHGDPNVCQLQNTVGGLFPKTPILREFNLRTKHTRRVGYVNASLLLNYQDASKDIVAHQLAKAYEKTFNSCIIVHDQFLPLDIFKVVSFMIQPSAPIVVFCVSLEPLVELQEYLLSERQATNVRIEELWTREQQVLPMRTHPNMNMHAASGYILSGIKISS